MSLARADLENLLRARRLDHTLTSTLPLDLAGRSFDGETVGATGVPALDARLGGGFPRGQLSEVVGLRSSGRTSLLLHMLASATARGELAALVDVLDMLDVGSAAAAGIHLERLLWVRGHVVVNPGFCREVNQRAMEQAIRALGLVLTSGHFGLVVFDAADVPIEAVRRLPFTTWLRLQRMVEGRQTICVLAGLDQMARSAAGLTVRLKREGREGREGQEGQEGQERSACGHAEPRTWRSEARHQHEFALGVAASAKAPARVAGAMQRPGPQGHWKKEGARFRGRLFEGLTVEARVVRARARAHEDTIVTFETRASGDG